MQKRCIRLNNGGEAASKTGRIFIMKFAVTLKTALLISTIMSAGFGGLAITSSPASAQDICSQSCHALWVARNQIYKNNGYCFKTRRAIRYFGNGGCWTRNPKLSAYERRLVNTYRQCERINGCR
jgi:hypothetical protein